MELVKKLYMAVTADRYELPVFVSDTALELAKVAETDYSNLFRDIKIGGVFQSGPLKGCRVMRVEVEDE